MGVMVRHQRIRIPLRLKMPGDAAQMSARPLANCADAMGARYNHHRVGRPGNSPDQIGRPSRSNRQASVAIAAADVDPLQSIWRPHPAPAAVIGGVGVGRANECKAMVAVMEEAVDHHGMRPWKTGARTSMRKVRTRKTAAAEMRRRPCRRSAWRRHPCRRHASSASCRHAVPCRRHPCHLPPPPPPPPPATASERR